METLIKVISAAIVVVILIVGAMTKGNAFSWSWWTSLGNATHATKSTNIEMAGNNGRVYDGIIKGVRCITVTTSEGVGVSCDWSNETGQNTRSLKKK